MPTQQFQLYHIFEFMLLNWPKCQKEVFKLSGLEVMKIMEKLKSQIHMEKALSGLNFSYLLSRHAKIVVCIDTAVAVNNDKPFQFWYIIVFIRHCQTTLVNIVDYSSTNGKWVCKSVLAAEMFSFIDGFDAPYAVSHAISELLGRSLNLTRYTDSRSLYWLCIFLAYTSTRGLSIDLGL